MNERDEYLLEAAAYTVVAVARWPFQFWMKVWEAAWTTD